MLDNQLLPCNYHFRKTHVPIQWDSFISVHSFFVNAAAGVKSGHFWKLLVKACGEALIEASLSLWSSFALTGVVQT